MISIETCDNTKHHVVSLSLYLLFTLMWLNFFVNESWFPMTVVTPPVLKHTQLQLQFLEMLWHSWLAITTSFPPITLFSPLCHTHPSFNPIHANTHLLMISHRSTNWCSVSSITSPVWTGTNIQESCVVWDSYSFIHLRSFKKQTFSNSWTF